MKKRKVYKIPPPEESGPLPSKVATDNFEKSLRAAAGAYYEAYPIKNLPKQKVWWGNVAGTLLPESKHKK